MHSAAAHPATTVGGRWVSPAQSSQPSAGRRPRGPVLTVLRADQSTHRCLRPLRGTAPPSAAVAAAQRKPAPRFNTFPMRGITTARDATGQEERRRTSIQRTAPPGRLARDTRGLRSRASAGIGRVGSSLRNDAKAPPANRQRCITYVRTGQSCSASRTTTYRFGSLPALSVTSTGRSWRCTCTIFRSGADIGSISTGCPVFSTSDATRSAAS